MDWTDRRKECKIKRASVARSGQVMKMDEGEGNAGQIMASTEGVRSPSSLSSLSSLGSLGSFS